MSGAGQPVAATRDFIVLADGERGAVLGPRGDVVWMCAPAWHSGSVFGALLGARGEYRIAPHGRFAWGGNYEPGTLVWRSKWITEDGVVTCREALAFPGDRRRAVLMRRVEAVDCDACLDVTLAPWAHYGDAAPGDVRREQDAWHARTGGLHVRWTGAGEAPFDADSDCWRWQLRLPAGARRDLVLEIADGELPAEQPDPEGLWAATADAWARAVPEFENSVDPEQSRHSYAVLRGLTGAAGGTVAAATTGLPEHAETGRDYDYRYVWIRDQCYVGEAVATDGPHPLLESATSFVAARLLADGAHTAPCYTCDGESVPSSSPLDVPGYPGGSASVGNGASEQFQLDLFGEALLLFAAAARHDRLDADGWRAAGIGAAAIADRWQQPDAGVWELDQKAWTHSRLIAAAGLTAVADARPPSGQADDWRALAEQITAHTASRATGPDGRWQRAPEDPRLDGALLLPGLHGIGTGDGHAAATLHGYLDELTRGGYAYRYQHDSGRPLGTVEGSFLMCGFVVALALHAQHDPVNAIRWFERSTAACGPPQLFSEEYDVTQHQQRGNLPQAFVHAFHLEATLQLHRTLEEDG